MNHTCLHADQTGGPRPWLRVHPRRGTWLSFALAPHAQGHSLRGEKQHHLGRYCDRDLSSQPIKLKMFIFKCPVVRSFPCSTGVQTANSPRGQRGQGVSRHVFVMPGRGFRSPGASRASSLWKEVNVESGDSSDFSEQWVSFTCIDCVLSSLVRR